MIPIAEESKFFESLNNLNENLYKAIEELKEASDFAHNLNKKIYVTVNIVFHDEDLNGLEEYLKTID